MNLKYYIHFGFANHFAVNAVQNLNVLRMLRSVNNMLIW